MNSHYLRLFSSGKAAAVRLVRYHQWPFWLTLFVNGAACLYLTHLIHRYQTYPFDGDEVNHALPSLEMANAISQNAWLEFLRIVYAQSFYPPAAAVMKSLGFVLVEPSFLSARLFTVVCLFFAILVLYALCVEIDPKNGGIAGLIAALLTLSSSSLLINAGLSMIEIPGLFASLLFLWAYVRLLQKRTTWRFFIVSLMMILVFLTKYSYGIVAVLTLGLTEAMLLSRVSNKQIRSTFRSHIVAVRWVYLFGPFLFVIVLWFLQPEKIEGFISFTQPLPSSEPWLSLQNAGSYLRSMAIHNLPAPLFAVVTVVGMVWTVQQWQERPLQPILLYFVIGMGMIMLVNHPVNPRFIVTFIPAVHVLTGLMITSLWRQRLLYEKQILPTVLLSVIVLSAALSLPNTWRRWMQLDSLMEVMVETDPAIDEMMGWIQQQVPPGQSVFLVNYWDQLSPNLFDWYQDVRCAHNMAKPIDYALMPPPTDEALASVRQSVIESQAGYLILFEGGPWGNPFWPEYTTALGDILTPVARHEFTVTSFEIVQSWLDDNSVTDPAWMAVRNSELHNLSIGVVVFKVASATSFLQSVPGHGVESENERYGNLFERSRAALPGYKRCAPECLGV